MSIHYQLVFNFYGGWLGDQIEKYNEYLSKLIYGLKNRGVFFSHEREIKQNNFVQ